MRRSGPVSYTHLSVPTLKPPKEANKHLRWSSKETELNIKYPLILSLIHIWKMLVVIWHVLRDGVPYTDYKKPEAIAEGNS